MVKPIFFVFSLPSKDCFPNRSNYKLMLTPNPFFLVSYCHLVPSSDPLSKNSERLPGKPMVSRQILWILDSLNFKTLWTIIFSWKPLTTPRAFLVKIFSLTKKRVLNMISCSGIIIQSGLNLCLMKPKGYLLSEDLEDKFYHLTFPIII